MPRVLENIQIGIAACRIGIRKCWRWMLCHKPLVIVVQDHYEVLCLGLTGAGKTSALAALVGDPIENIEPTTGFNIKTLPVRDTVLNIKELGGSENIQPFWNRYFHGQNGVLFVVNSASTDEQLSDAREVLQHVLGDSMLKSIPCVILATHQDVEDARSKEELEQYFHGVLHGRKWTIQTCSSQDREGVCRGLEVLVDLMCKNT